MKALPALIEDDGTVLFESLAILEYLDETHPNPPLLPKEPKARARVRGLAQIIACDTHPLIVPRVREYLAHEYKIDEAGRAEMGSPLARGGLEGAGEPTLAGSQQTGRYCQGDQITIADICLAGQAAGSTYFKVGHRAVPDRQAHRRFVHAERRLRARASDEAARRARGGLTACSIPRSSASAGGARPW